MIVSCNIGRADAKLVFGLWLEAVPPRGSGWVRSLKTNRQHRLRTHPLPRGGTDCFQPKTEDQNHRIDNRDIWLNGSCPFPSNLEYIH
jgi:hypothetical protein